PRAGGADWVVLAVALATFLVGELPQLFVSPQVQGLTDVGSCSGACPANPALVVDAPNVAATFRHVEGSLQVAWGVALLFYLATRFLLASHARRRLLLPVFVSAAPFVTAFSLHAAVFDLAAVLPIASVRALFAVT